MLIQRRFHNQNNVAGLLRNDWPDCSGLGGRFAAESVAGLLRNTQEQFIVSFNKAPKKLILDFDATDDPLHGCQEGRFFQGYYRHYCFLPLYVFCGDRLLVAYLRPSNIDGAKHSWAIL